MSARPSRRRSALLALPLVVGLALAASACSQGGHGQLLLAEDTTVSPDQASAPTATDIWAVDPGDDPTDDDLVATDVSSPLYINDLQEDGSLARDLLATQWSGQVLASFIRGDGSSASATVGTPGDDPVEIATSDSQVQSNILRRGVFVATTDGCKLFRSSDDIEDIGTGLCQVSEDERWVVSWPASGGELTIRDLRHDDVRTVEGDTTSAVALGSGSTVLAVQRTDAGSQGVVIDATDGSIIGRTDTFDDLQAMPVEQGSTGFVALAASTSQAATVDATTLLWIGTDAKVRVIDRGALMLPVHTDSEVTYVHFGGQETGTDSIRRWDSASAERQTLLSGAVGAASVGDGRIVATKDTAKGVELYRSDDHGDLVHATTVPGDATGGSTVSRIFTQGDTSILELTFDGATSLARVDLSGDDSDVPVKRWAAMLLEGIDTDGTVLLSGAEGNTAEEQSIGVVTPSSDAFVERTTAASTGLNVIHEGVIYVTDQSEGGLKVRTVRAQGDLDAETLYEGYQVAGTTWPTDNGATQSTLISRVAVLSQQQQAQQRQAQGQAQSGG
jgi:hypothetical protein